MKLIFPLFILFAIGQSHATAATFQGNWAGKGTLNHSSGRIENCDLHIDIDQAPLVFFVKKSVFQCESMKIENKNPAPLDIRNGELWWGSRKLGIITENLIKTSMQSPDGRKQSYRLEIQSSHLLQYRDYVEWAPGYSTQISGQLKDLNPYYRSRTP